MRAAGTLLAASFASAYPQVQPGITPPTDCEVVCVSAFDKPCSGFWDKQCAEEAENRCGVKCAGETCSCGTNQKELEELKAKVNALESLLGTAPDSEVLNSSCSFDDRRYQQAELYLLPDAYCPPRVVSADPSTGFGNCWKASQDLGLLWGGRFSDITGSQWSGCYYDGNVVVYMKDGNQTKPPNLAYSSVCAREPTPTSVTASRLEICQELCSAQPTTICDTVRYNTTNNQCDFYPRSITLTTSTLLVQPGDPNFIQAPRQCYSDKLQCEGTCSNPDGGTWNARLPDLESGVPQMFRLVSVLTDSEQRVYRLGTSNAATCLSNAGVSGQWPGASQSLDDLNNYFDPPGTVFSLCGRCFYLWRRDDGIYYNGVLETEPVKYPSYDSPNWQLLYKFDRASPTCPGLYTSIDQVFEVNPDILPCSEPVKRMRLRWDDCNTLRLGTVSYAYGFNF